MKCIDVHVHLGDVCKPYSINSDTSISKIPSNTLERLDYPSLLQKAIASDFYPKKQILKFCGAAGKIATPKNLNESMESSNISRSWILPIWPAVSTDDVLSMCWENDKFDPLLSVDFSVRDPESIKKYIRDCMVKYPFKGIKFHPNLQNIDPTSDEAIALYTEAADQDLFVMMHVGKTPFLSKPSNARSILSNVVELPKIYYKTKFIFCHMAKYFDPSSDGFTKIMKYENVWLDTSGVADWLLFDGLSAVGHHRVLFGSDWPYGDQARSLSRLESVVKRYSRHNKFEFEEVMNSICFENAESFVKSNRMDGN